MIKKGEYFRGSQYKALGGLLERELETFFQAEDVGASKGSKNEKRRQRRAAGKAK